MQGGHKTQRTRRPPNTTKRLKSTNTYLVCFLHLLWHGDLACAYGPNGLVGNYDETPVSNLAHESVQLTGNNVADKASFTLLKVLADAHSSVQLLLLRDLDLLGHHFIGFPEHGTTLGVTEQGPLNIQILQHRNGNLTSEGAALLLREVLDTHLELAVVQSAYKGSYLQGAWEDHDLCIQVILR